MFRFISNLNDELQPNCFYYCPDDRLALRLINDLYCSTSYDESPLTLIKLPRPRKVGQIYLTSIFTTLWTLIFCIYTLLWNYTPDMV